MSRSLPSPVFWAACLMCTGLGWSIAAWREPQAIPPAPVGDHSSSASTSASRAFSGDGSKTALPLTREVLLRRLLAKMPTPQLWEWLREQKDMQSGISGNLVAELVDRLGWKAWDEALTIDGEQRETITDAVLSRLSVQDTWKAYEIWKQKRSEFGEMWGWKMDAAAVRAASKMSGSVMVDVLRTAECDGQRFGSYQKFTKDFDFGTVLDYLNQSGKGSIVLPYNLFDDWTQNSPLQAAEWLVVHPEWIEKGGRIDVSPNSMIRSIAGMPAETPGRAEALEKLSQMPADFIKDSWETYPQASGGKYSAELRAVAASMGQEDAYLPATLAQTQWEDTLDPSWQEVPVNERDALLEKAQSVLKPAAKLSPVEVRYRQRWLQMVKRGWGLAE